MSAKLGQLLIDAGVIDEQQLRAALAEQKKTSARLGDTLIDLGLITEYGLSQALANQSGVEHVELDDTPIERGAVQLVPESLARDCNAVPLRIEGSSLVVAMSVPSDIVAIDELQRQTDLFVRVSSAGHRQVQRALDRAYSEAEGGVELDDDLVKRALAEIEETSTERGTVVALVDDMLGMAIRRDASDLHLQPDKRMLRTRLRIDGDLVAGPALPLGLLPSIVARIKVLSGLDISEARLPQDGKIRFSYGTSIVDMRVSTFPTTKGESVVVRILDKDKQAFSLDDLGLDARGVQILRRVASRPNGLVLAVGPTGSGKSTTLFSVLRAVDGARRKIISLEDPVEYDIGLATQCQVNEKAGLTFATGLRAILRHDPDVVLVGEIRDRETAKLALHASLTGHLVLSTLHTNHAVATTLRLVEMDLDPYLIASSLVAVAAQRLARKICGNCRYEYEPTPEELEAVGLSAAAGTAFARGKGCDRCNGTGLRGREAIFEVLEVTPEVARLIARGAPEEELAEAARAGGMTPFREMAQRRAVEGRISLSEVANVTTEF
jgi:type IV pilus assembly protein PilB